VALKLPLDIGRNIRWRHIVWYQDECLRFHIRPFDTIGRVAASAALDA
jgi:hypothetical protein